MGLRCWGAMAGREARTQVAFISVVDMGATEDAASRPFSAARRLKASFRKGLYKSRSRAAKKIASENVGKG